MNNWQTAIVTRLEKACIEHVFPGCVVGVASAKAPAHILPYGKFTYDSVSLPVQADSIYDVASITKAIPVSCAALLLIEKGLLSVETKLIDVIPEYCGLHRENIRIMHLLTQTLDWGFRLADCKALSPQDILRVIFSAPLESLPGTRFSYANATSILLGLVVERISGLRLDEFAAVHFFKPLHMRSTSFFPEKLNLRRIVPTEQDPWRGRDIRGEIHDESAFALRPNIIAGSAGLFSTTSDMCAFCSMLLRYGSVRSLRVFKPETVTSMHTNQIASIGASASLGWELAQPRYMGTQSSSDTFGKTGFTGTSVVISPSYGCAVVILSNCTWPRRAPNRNAIDSVRQDVADIIFEAAANKGLEL